MQLTNENLKTLVFQRLTQLDICKRFQVLPSQLSAFIAKEYPESGGSLTWLRVHWKLDKVTPAPAPQAEATVPKPKEPSNRHYQTCDDFPGVPCCPLCHEQANAPYDLQAGRLKTGGIVLLCCTKEHAMRKQLVPNDPEQSERYKRQKEKTNAVQRTSRDRRSRNMR
jgi:hypothetical protein